MERTWCTAILQLCTCPPSLPEGEWVPPSSFKKDLGISQLDSELRRIGSKLFLACSENKQARNTYFQLLLALTMYGLCDPETP